MFIPITLLVTSVLLIGSCVSGSGIELSTLENANIIITIEGEFDTKIQLQDITVLKIYTLETNNVTGFLCPSNGNERTAYRMTTLEEGKRRWEVDLLPTPKNIDQLLIHKEIGITCYAIIANDHAVIFQVRYPIDTSVAVISEYRSPYESIDNKYKEFIDDNIGDDIVIGASITALMGLLLTPIIVLAINSAFQSDFNAKRTVQVVNVNT